MVKFYLKISCILFFLGFYTGLFSQSVGINTTNATPSSNAILDLNTGNAGKLGFIIPSVVLGSSLTYFSPASGGPMVGNPTANDVGMIVYNDNSFNQPVGYYYWNGATWVSFGGSAGPSGSGTLNYVARWTTGSNLGIGVSQDNGTNAGISSAVITPKSLLDVNGGMDVGTYAGTNAAPANGMIVSGQVGIGTSSPLATAALDVTSTSLGFLAPRMTTAQMNAIASPDIGLTVYNTTTGCLEYNYNGTSPAGWVAMQPQSSQTFSTAGYTSWTIPNCVNQITVTVTGGGGGGAYNQEYANSYTNTALPGVVEAIINTTGMATLDLYVGSVGGTGTATATGTAGTNGNATYGAGGAGCNYSPYSAGYSTGGGGGASSEIWNAANRIIVAGGAGGVGTATLCNSALKGGNGCTPTTGTGVSNGTYAPNYCTSTTEEGGGGTTVGGPGGSYQGNNIALCPYYTAPTAGNTNGVGGNGGYCAYYQNPFCYIALNTGGGGGGGYCGGGGGGGQGGGGGGSSYANSTYIYGNAIFTNAATAAANGSITIVW